MAKYWEDWSGSTIGQNPTGWTKRWVTTGYTSVVEADATAPGGAHVTVKSFRIDRKILDLYGCGGR